MGYDFAFIGRLNTTDETITTVSFVEHGKVIPNIIYPIKDTPCELVTAEKKLFFPSDIQSTFPNDQFLIDKGIESYVGAPVFDKRGNPIGLVSVLNRSPIESPVPVLPILQILVSQVGAEIERSLQSRRW